LTAAWIAAAVLCASATSPAVQGSEGVLRGWRDQRATRRLPNWYPELREHFNPAREEWWAEAAAQAVELRLRSALTEALAGRSLEGGVFDAGETFTGATPLVPVAEELVELRSDALLRVERWVSSAPPRPTSEPVVERVSAWLAPMIGAGVGAGRSAVAVHVIESTQVEKRRFETRVRIRVGGRTAEGERQDNVEWRVTWDVPAGSDGPVLNRLEVTAYERVVAYHPLFAELTLDLLADGRFASEDLMLGAPEQKGRLDRSVGFPEVYLGMHGMAVGDIDGDGLLDLFVAMQGGRPNALFLQTPDGRMREVSREAGLDQLEDTAGVVIVDMDGNGARDLLLAVRNGVLIAYNEGPCRFEREQFLVCPGPEQVYSVSAADADGDGDLDLYATRYVKGGVVGGVPTPYHNASNGAPNSYFRNDEGTFVEATAEVGLDVGNDRFSLASIWEDLDGDALAGASDRWRDTGAGNRVARLSWAVHEPSGWGCDRRGG
jgi:hypothetical protein